MQKLKVAVLGLLSSIALSGHVFSQDPVPLRQYYFNPYLFNPSYNASSGFTEVSIIHRRQWITINDAPTTNGLNVQIPTRSRVSLGFNFLSQEVIGLRNSSLMATFAYAIPLAEAQFFRFGLSGGVGLNDLNLKEGEYDPNDPIIINALTNNYYANGNFGLSYTNRGFTVGFALPQLFKVPYAGSESGEFSTDKFSPKDYQLVTASYKIKPGRASVSVEPYVVYRHADNMGINSLDVAALLSYRDFLSFGGSYNSTQGPGFFFSLKIKGFRFGYSFEVPTGSGDFVKTTSHEVQLGMRFGPQKGPVLASSTNETDTAEHEEPTEAVAQEADTKDEKADSTRVAEQAAREKTAAERLREAQAVEEKQTQRTDVAVTEAAPVRETAPMREDASVRETETAPIKDVANGKTGPSAPPRSFSLTKGYYVVVGVFKNMQNAISVAQDFVLKGYSGATVAIHPQNNLYYVYIFSSYNVDEARKVRNQTRMKRPLSEAWILNIDMP